MGRFHEIHRLVPLPCSMLLLWRSLTRACRFCVLGSCRQDPVECLFSFICSSNNNIPRITLMLARLRARYGTSIPLYQANNNGTANDSHRGKKRPRTHGGSEDDEVRDTAKAGKAIEGQRRRQEEGGRLTLGVAMCV